jgi:hypothetical protein
VAGEWPEGFRLKPDARFDDEMQRLSQAADADVTFRLVERNESVRECTTGCSEPAVCTVIISTPDKKTMATFDLCEAHGQAASNDRTNAKLGISAERQFIDDKLGGDAEKVREIEPLVTNPNLQWQTVRLVERTRDPIARDTLRPGDVQGL